MVIGKVAANYPVIWVPTVEYDRFRDALASEVEERLEGFSTYCWDVERGILEWEGDGWRERDPNQDPLSPIQFGKSSEQAVIILLDFDKFLSSPEVLRALLNAVSETEGRLVSFVIVSPNLSALPPELERYTTVEEFELPTEEELLSILKDICEVNELPLPENIEGIARAGRGLTLFEFSRACTLSVVETGEIKREFILSQKEQLVRKNPVLELYHPENLDEIKGLERAREFIKKMATSSLGRGVLLLGVPGTGKSLLAKSVGKELGLPVISLNFEAVFDRFVGSSEQRIREALKVIDAVAPCIVFIDEIEKGLSGLASSNSTDGGTTARVFGSFLKWLNDRESSTYVIATANDVSKLPPEFLRAERWDAIFFVDLPTERELEELLTYYCSVFGVEKTLSPKDLSGWTGAEVKSLCRTAKALGIDLKEAKEFVKPLSATMGEKIERLREWASARCVPASKEVRPFKKEKRKVAKAVKVGH